MEVSQTNNPFPIVAFLEVTGRDEGVSNACLWHDEFFEGEIDGLHKSTVVILPLELWEEQIKPLLSPGRQAKEEVTA